MARIIPQSKPKLTRQEAERLLIDNGIDLGFEKIVVIGIRGYYKNTFGKPFENDRNFYDDACFVITKSYFGMWNFNVDPSKFRKGIATLVKGVYRLIKWKHKGEYAALQVKEDTVSRDGDTKLDRGRHGINFHYGGDDDTWSEGCQTFPKKQFQEFQGTVYSLMDSFGLKEVTYLLIEN